MIKTGRDKKIWQELQKQLDATRRSKDGTWTKKNSKSYFRYKFYSKEDIDQVDLSKHGEVAI